MELFQQHILPLLKSFTNETHNSPYNIISEIQNDSKIDFIEIICYLERILNLNFLTTTSGLSTLHIHIENELDDSQKLLIAEYLNIRLFKYYHSIDNQTNVTNILLLEFISIIEAKLTVLEMRCPENAIGKNGGNRIWKNWVKEKKQIRSLLEFYKALNINSSIKPKSLFNVQKNIYSSLSQLFEFRPYCTTINNKYKTYNLLNVNNSLNEIDLDYKEIIDELDSVILFDCERKRVMINFSHEEINKWNTNYNTRFTKYLIITFGKEICSINNTRNKLELIRERFKIPSNSSYTITKSEIDLLRNKIKSTPLDIEFV